MPKERKNKAEAAFEQRMQSQGWTVTKRGWPDFICYKNGEVCLVEVKGHGRRLKANQRQVMHLLMSYGVPCYHYDERMGLRTIY